MKPILVPLRHLVSRYPLVFVPFAVLLALVWGLSPDGFDAFHVVWADAALTSIASGFAVGVYFGAVMLLVRALDEFREDDESVPVGAEPPSYFRAWVLVCGLAVLPALARGDLFPTRVTLGDGTVSPIDPKFVVLGFHQTRLYFPLGVLLALGGGLLGTLWSRKSKQTDGIALNRRERTFGWVALWVVAFGYVVMCVAHWIAPDFYLSGVPAAVTGVLLFGLCTAVAAGLHRVSTLPLGRRLFYPVVFGVLVGLVMFGGYLEPSHRVNGLDDYYANEDKRPKLEKYEEYRKAPSTLVKDKDALKAWQARMSENGKQPTGPVVVVSVSGGASTSAVFVARALFRLELRFPGFVSRVRIISGASGGMLGAAYYVSQMRPGSPYREEARERDPDPERRRLFLAYRDRLRDGRPAPENDPDEKKYQDLSDQLERGYIAGMEADFLSPLFQKWVHKDMNPAVWLFNKSTTNDRGTALEGAWDRALKGRPTTTGKDQPPGWDPNQPALGVPFDDLCEERAGLIPSLVFTPMMIEDGRQMIISNLDLDYMVDWGSQYDTAAGERSRAYSAAEFYRLFPDAVGKFKLGTAVRLNASFPFLSPAAELPTNPPRRVVDAGYYDNYGLIVPVRWLEQNAADLEKSQTPVWVLQLWTYGYDQLSTSLTRAADEDTSTGLQSSTAPLTGLFSAWRANMAYRGEERLNRFLFNWNEARHNAKKDPIAFRFRKDIGKSNLPMNWVLTSYNLARIDGEAETARDLINAVSTVVTKSPTKDTKDVTADEVIGELMKGDKPPQTQQNSASLKQQAEFATELYKLQRPPAKRPDPKKPK